MEATGNQWVEVHFFSAWRAEGGVGPPILVRKGQGKLNLSLLNTKRGTYLVEG